MSTNGYEDWKLDSLKFCKYCERMGLRIHYSFEFFNIENNSELTRNVKICNTCGTIHYLEYPAAPYLAHSTLYLINRYDRLGENTNDYEKVDAKANKLDFWETGTFFNETGESVLTRDISTIKLKKYTKRYYDGHTYYHEDNSKIKVKPKFKVQENQHQVKITGNISRFVL